MKSIKWMLLFLTLFILSGCTKIDSSMEIHLDKSINLSISVGLSEEISFDRALKEAKKHDFKAIIFEEDNMKGIKLEKKIINIDEVSHNEEIVFDLSNLILKKHDFIFQIKKGFFRNIYVAKMQLNMNMIKDELNLNDTVLATKDIKFQVHLPFGTLSNNASIVSNTNKDLVWDLKTHQDYIEFEFFLFNWIPILVISLGLLFFIIFIIFLLRKNKQNKERKRIQNLEPIPGLKVEPIPVPENKSQLIENNINQPTINQFVQPSITVPIDDSRLENMSQENQIQYENTATLDNTFRNGSDSIDLEYEAIKNDSTDSLNVLSSERINILNGMEEEKNQPTRKDSSNESVLSSSPFFSSNVDNMNTNTLSSESNLDTVNGQVMQDLKVEDVFNLTQIQENENEQIKNPDDYDI